MFKEDSREAGDYINEPKSSQQLGTSTVADPGLSYILTWCTVTHTHTQQFFVEILFPTYSTDHIFPLTGKCYKPIRKRWESSLPHHRDFTFIFSPLKQDPSIPFFKQQWIVGYLSKALHRWNQLATVAHYRLKIQDAPQGLQLNRKQGSAGIQEPVFPGQHC